MIDVAAMIRRLAEHQVRFIVVGGMAAVAHGSARLTQDLDIVYARGKDDLTRLAAALGALAPYPRGAPPGLPFVWDQRTLANGLNFTLTTALGDLDVLGEIPGGGGYEALLPHCVTLELFGVACQSLDLETLIRTKRAAGRPKDFEAIAELELILEERRQGE
ncbi:MAG: hypothetical protein EXR72_05255 [Myxococcales bacterium]|nr:hypothetical protein [Myxococcales bacterium]